MSSVDLQFTPLVLELSLIRSHLLWGKFTAFSAANAIHNFSNFRSTRYPSLLGGQRQHGMRSLPDTSTHDHQRESNPTPDHLILSPMPYPLVHMLHNNISRCVEWYVLFQCTVSQRTDLNAGVYATFTVSMLTQLISLTLLMPCHICI